MRDVKRVMRAVIYVRVSRAAHNEGSKQDELRRQEEKCRVLADLRGWEVVEVAEDRSISAYSGKDRPGWNKVLRMIADGTVDIVIAYHLDRLTRSMADLESLITLAVDNEVGIATVSGDIDMSTDMGRMIARILAAVARAEVERKAERAKLANGQKAAAGVPHAGPRPFGYSEDRITIVGTEADAIREAARLTLDGVPLGETARRWTALGYKTGQGRSEWSRQALKTVLTNPRNVGDRAYNGEVVGTGVWKPILDRQTYSALVAMLSDPSRIRNPTGQGRTPTTLLSGSAFCGVCGDTVKGKVYARQGAVKEKIQKYACRKGCVSTPRDEADDWATANVIALLSDPEADFLAAFAGVGDQDALAVREKIDWLNDQLNEIAHLVRPGGLTVGQAAIMSQELRGQLEQAEREAMPVSARNLLEDLDVGTDAVAEQWYGLPLARRRALIDAFFEITVSRRASKWDKRPVEEIVQVKRREAFAL